VEEFKVVDELDEGDAMKLSEKGEVVSKRLGKDKFANGESSEKETTEKTKRRGVIMESASQLFTTLTQSNENINETQSGKKWRTNLSRLGASRALNSFRFSGTFQREKKATTRTMTSNTSMCVLANFFLFVCDSLLFSRYQAFNWLDLLKLLKPSVL